MMLPAIDADLWGEFIEHGFPDAVVRPAEELGIDDTPGQCHIVAALCLHGQHFGFTWDDVDAVRAVTNMAEVRCGEDELAWKRTVSVIDRIAALLPPREP